MTYPTRRTFLLTLFALTLTSPVFAQENLPIYVVKDPGCPCCNAWIGYLRENGFVVSFEERSTEELAAFKRQQGIPDALVSCHTATVGGYTIEGHVPAVDIRRLLADAPDAIGLTVPGMPYGSPGMGSEAEREAYDVILIGRDGSASTFSRYEAA
ncbi:DUF411 domain-containing protein [Albidovulum sediminis]|uniref:DUF411 domain-containing protein n=1 Tax=Albidovulum sediminis TaxID=3066345 RepID=A0ABT2NRQ1_9RHOB|nr:DUF411 domain-containing protein [Defluviimonas sediminis]